ncbi:MAG TPA: hypothetical protein VJR89_19575 [Polyangiales bacterium]|nr:hypothetical protein [Polyangiales bacterium]
MSIELSTSDGPSTALTLPSPAERRVQRAKQRLAQHFALLDYRARELARQTAWVAGMVLLGLAGMAAAATLFGGRTRRKRARSGSGMYYASGVSAGGAGTALMLAAFGLLSRRVRQGRTRGYSI